MQVRVKCSDLLSLSATSAGACCCPHRYLELFAASCCPSFRMRRSATALMRVSCRQVSFAVPRRKAPRRSFGSQCFQIKQPNVHGTGDVVHSPVAAREHDHSFAHVRPNTRTAPDTGLVDLGIFSCPGADAVSTGPRHASAEPAQDTEGGLASRYPKSPLKPHCGHAFRLFGDHTGGPEPCAQRRVAALHERAGSQSRLAAAGAAGQHARSRGQANLLPQRDPSRQAAQAASSGKNAETREVAAGITGRRGRERPRLSVHAARPNRIEKVYMTTG